MFLSMGSHLLIIKSLLFELMKPKPGVNTGKPTTGKTANGPTAGGAKGPDPKHLPREFK
jgi:hypothetical protein